MEICGMTDFTDGVVLKPDSRSALESCGHSRLKTSKVLVSALSIDQSQRNLP